MKPATCLSLLAASIALIGLAIPLPLEAQVEVIRQLPQSGANQGTATWSEPYPEPAAVRASGQPRFTGRVSVGGRGGQNPTGEALYDVVTDSRVTLVQPLGQSAVMSLDAAALRARSAVDENQKYDGSLSLDFERLQFQASGGYHQSFRPVAGIDKEDTDAQVAASLSSGLIETLPMSVTYRSAWIERSDDELPSESTRSDELSFNAAGALGRIGVELRATLEHEDDREEQNETLGTAGNLRITLPVAQALAVEVSAVPNFNRSQTAGQIVRSSSLESGLGILWTVVEDLRARVGGSRVDAWSEGPGADYEPHRGTWKGELGVDYRPPAGLFAGPAYGLAKTTGGNLTHDLALPVGWRGTGKLNEISGFGAASLIRSEAGGRVNDVVDWGLNLTVAPAARMSLSSNYRGGLVWLQGSESWNHKLASSFNHSPDPLLEYRGAFGLSNNREAESGGLWKHHYQAGLTLKPQWNLRLYRVDLSETLAVSNGPSGDDLLSTAALDASIPITPEIATRLGAQWEWINRIAPGEEPGHNFLYTAGLSVAGQAAPLSLTAQYAFAHGYRGARHDISSGLQVPLRRGFTLEGVFTLSSYDQEGSSSLPFLLGLNLAYEF